jgi:isopenicillin N synthase-like dioxygenase
MGKWEIDYRSPEAAQEITQALHEIGFAILRNHPVSAELIEAVYQEWVDFFGSEQKHDYHFKAEVQSGYFPFQTESAKGYSQPDLKEFFHLYKPENLPKNMSERSWLLFESLVSLASELLSWIEVELPEPVRAGFSVPLSSMIEQSQQHLLRILHYPPLPQDHALGAFGGAVRAAPHEDINLITLLPAALELGSETGLEILNRQGNWQPVPSLSGDIVINVGDMLQLASGKYLRSTTHRVINPQGANSDRSRYSLPMFLHARSDVFVAENKTAGAYLRERLQEIGLV